MRHCAILPYLGISLLASCTSVQPSPAHDQVYVCSRESELAEVSSKHRVVIVRAAAAGSGRQVVLDFGDGQAQMLEPVRDSSERLFANSLYAWRLGQDSDILTDVERVATYKCQPSPAGSTGPASGSSQGGV